LIEKILKRFNKNGSLTINLCRGVYLDKTHCIKKGKVMRIYLKFSLFLIVLFLLAACGSSAVVNKSMNELPNANQAKYTVDGIKSDVKDVPDHFLAAINGYLEGELKKQDLLAEAGAGNPYKINIIVTDYRMRSNMSRVMLGALAGKDGVESHVTVMDPVTGEVVGESTVSTFNVTAVEGMDDVAEMHAEEIAKFVSGDIK
jgi:hypothetical protein